MPTFLSTQTGAVGEIAGDSDRNRLLVFAVQFSPIYFILAQIALQTIGFGVGSIFASTHENDRYWHQ